MILQFLILIIVTFFLLDGSEAFVKIFNIDVGISKGTGAVMLNSTLATVQKATQKGASLLSKGGFCLAKAGVGVAGVGAAGYKKVKDMKNTFASKSDLNSVNRSKNVKDTDKDSSVHKKNTGNTDGEVKDANVE